MITTLINTIQDIYNYFNNREFEYEVEPNTFKIDSDGFRNKIEEWAKVFEQSLVGVNNISTQEATALNQAVEKTKALLLQFHEPALTGIEEPFKDNFFRYAHILQQKANIGAAADQPLSLKPAQTSSSIISKKQDEEISGKSLSNRAHIVNQYQRASASSTPVKQQKMTKRTASTLNLPQFTTKITREPQEQFSIYEYVPRTFISDQPWKDLPKSKDIAVILPSDQSAIKGLLKMIDAYHACSKSSVEQLTTRIKLLGFINHYVNDIYADFLENGEVLNNLITQTCNKALYLGALYERSIIDHYILSEDLRKSYHGLELVKNSGSDSHTINMDPCFRAALIDLNPIYNEWKSKSKTNSVPVDFFLWLEDKDEMFENIRMQFSNCDPSLEDNSRLLRKISRIKMMQEKESLYFVDNKLEKLNSIPKIEYVIDANNQLWLNYNLDNFKKGGNHPTITGDGKAVLCGGHITIENGKITYIDNNSGHFRPSKRQLWQALCLLNQRGLISSNATIGYIQEDLMIKPFSEVKPHLVSNPRYKYPDVTSVLSDKYQEKTDKKNRI